MKKNKLWWISLILTCCMLIGIFPNVNTVAEGYEIEGIPIAEDSNAQPDRISIRTAEELATIGREINFAGNSGVTFVLENDIWLTEEWTPIRNFNEIFDGQGYTIHNLFILESSSYHRAGLFANTERGAVIRNVNIRIGEQGVTASNADTSENPHIAAHAGGLIGVATSTHIYNVHITGNVSAVCENGQRTHPESSTAGGIVGRFYYGISIHGNNGSIQKSSMMGDIFLKNGGSGVGGLIGHSSHSVRVGGMPRLEISNSFSTGSVSHAPYGFPEFNTAIIGGLVGGRLDNEVSIVNSYSTSNIFVYNSNASDGRVISVSVGGLLGSGVSSTRQPLVTNSFRLATQNITGGNAINLNIDSRGTPLSISQMRIQSYFTDWDFDTIWEIRSDRNNGFPILRGQNAGSINLPPLQPELNESGYYLWTSNNGGTPIRNWFYQEYEIIYSVPIGTRIFVEYYLINSCNNKWYLTSYIPGLGYGEFWIYSGNLSELNSELAVMFEQNSHIYNHELAILGSDLSAIAYGRSFSQFPMLPLVFELESLGFQSSDIYWYDYDHEVRSDNHRVAHTIALKPIKINDTRKNLIIVVVRGSHNEEWFSNFYICSQRYGGHNPDVHYGFSRAEQVVRENLTNILNERGLTGVDVAQNNIIFITGHSRGAGVANILANELNQNTGLVLPHNLYAYTFATPNTTRAPQASPNIFNILNAEDFVAYIPLEAWGFARHGRTYYFPTQHVADESDYTRFFGQILVLWYMSEAPWASWFNYPPLHRHGFLGVASVIDDMVENLASSIDEFYNSERFWRRQLITNYRLMRTTHDVMLNTVAAAASGVNAVGAGTEMGLVAIDETSQFHHIIRLLVGESVFNLFDMSSHGENTYRMFIRAIDGYNHLVPENDFNLRRASINTNVDIRIYDTNENLLGQIVDGKIDDSMSPDIFILNGNSAKHIYFPSSGTITIRFVATASGTMSYAINDMRFPTLEILEAREFHNVPLTFGREMLSEIVANTPDVRLLIVEDGQVVGEIAEDGTETMFNNDSNNNDNGSDDNNESGDGSNDSNNTSAGNNNNNNGTDVGNNNNVSGGVESSTSDSDSSIHIQLLPVVPRPSVPEQSLSEDYGEEDSPSEEPAVLVPEMFIPPPPPRGQLPFTDVSPTAWFYPYVRTVWERGIFQGTSQNRFSPQQGMTRAMFAQMLANHEGISTQGYTTSTFGDVSTTAWYFGAVEWAAQMGIVEGVGNGNFVPSDQITREQMAVMLYRYANVAGTALPQGTAITFSDQNTIAHWAANGVSAIQRAGIITGRPNGNFDPRATATRAEVAALFARFLEVTE